MLSTLLFGPQPQSAPLLVEHQPNTKQTKDKKAEYTVSPKWPWAQKHNRKEVFDVRKGPTADKRGVILFFYLFQSECKAFNLQKGNT